MDMDGVLVHEEQRDPRRAGVHRRLLERGLPFLVLTNNSRFTRRDLAARPAARAASTCREESIWTSALATATFLESQRPGGDARSCVGEAGLTTALHETGYTMTEVDPDYVVLGETRTYSLRGDHARRSASSRAARASSRRTPTPVGPSARRPAPGDRRGGGDDLAAAAGVDPYYVGKPNPLMMRSALNAIDAHSESTAMIGDRMDTRHRRRASRRGLETILVLTGVTSRDQTERFPYRPSPHPRLGRRRCVDAL